MKSTQIFPMFAPLTEAQEVSLCGGESNVVSYSNIIIGKKGVKKQTTKVVKTKTTQGRISVSGLLKSLGINLSSLLKFDW
ncbi:hypothetical protein NIES4072_07250 [Nostoc commune NIES-4072]|uniref:Uncharacterized protein n=1 Tax=Nostoc commune NIES-4072 TaxID=2005467 RepID=A0A2R5FF20_NOSCO|nr:hypothetical protein [Nostoc commune]BBD65600.1 hypothetical protein NIES4070_19580 [Nostoc commune HK-02]GBG17076.1 hypothetical protein NIES4072_07250 [Nostoc commune NIES-4072]